MPIKNTAALLLEEPRVRDHRDELVYLPLQYGPSLLVDIRQGKFGELGFEAKVASLAAHWNTHSRLSAYFTRLD